MFGGPVKRATRLRKRRSRSRQALPSPERAWPHSARRRHRDRAESHPRGGSEDSTDSRARREPASAHPSVISRVGNRRAEIRCGPASSRVRGSRARGARQPFRENGKITGSFSSRKTRNGGRDDSRLKMGSRLIHEPFRKVRESQIGRNPFRGVENILSCKENSKAFQLHVRADDLEIRSKQIKATGLEVSSGEFFTCCRLAFQPLEAELDLAEMAGCAASVRLPILFKPPRLSPIWPPGPKNWFYMIVAFVLALGGDAVDLLPLVSCWFGPRTFRLRSATRCGWATSDISSVMSLPVRREAMSSRRA